MSICNLPCTIGIFGEVGAKYNISTEVWHECLSVIYHVLGIFGEVGAKYKNKYRSLTYNIKDVKNDGLFRRILLKDLSAIEVKLSSKFSRFLHAIWAPGYALYSTQYLWDVKKFARKCQKCANFLIHLENLKIWRSYLYFIWL